MPLCCIRSAAGGLAELRPDARPVSSSNYSPDTEHSGWQVGQQCEVHAFVCCSHQQVCSLKLGENAARPLHVCIQVALTQHVLVYATQNKLMIAKVAQHTEDPFALICCSPLGLTLWTAGPSNLYSSDSSDSAQAIQRLCTCKKQVFKNAYLSAQELIPDAESPFAKILLPHVEGSNICSPHPLALFSQELQGIQAGAHITGCPLS